MIELDDEDIFRRWKGIQLARATEINLERELSSLFLAAKDELFEDGKRSTFAANLMALIERHGQSAVETVADFTLRPTTSPRVAAEALRWIARIDQPSTYLARRRILESGLQNPHAEIRDGAVLGLASVNDPHVIGLLEAAIQTEGNFELREDMEQLLAEWQDLRVT